MVRLVSKARQAWLSCRVGELPGITATRSLQLPCGKRVRLRPLAYADGARWSELRLSDRDVLEPVEPTVSGTWDDAHSLRAWPQVFQVLRAAAHYGEALSFAIELDGLFVGQVTLGNIQRGVANECWIGYWVHSAHTGLGVATAACALGVDYAFGALGVHRVTATYLSSNPASKRVLELNGFIEEGYQRRSLHIAGRWQDHHQVAVVCDDYPLTAAERLRLQRRVVEPSDPASAPRVEGE